jgi:membrane protein YdbS with pleckstrin-like domain
MEANGVITLTCDNCDKPFQIEDDAAGEKVACPYCADVQRVPAGAAAEAGIEKAAPAVVPKPQAKPHSDSAAPEQTIAVVRVAMFRAHPFWYMLMVLILIGGAALAVLVPNLQQFANARWLLWVGLAAMAAAVLWWIIWWAAPHRWVKLTITSKRTIRQEGIVMRQTSEVLHNHIRNVKIEQSFLQRLLGVGAISIDSAGGSEGEIHMKDVPNPYGVKAMIDKYRFDFASAVTASLSD